MKRVFSTLFAVLITVSAFAGNPFSITSGKKNLKQIFTDKATAVISIDWSNAKYDNKKELKAELGGDYEFVVKDCLENFIEKFNEESKGLCVSDKAERAKYKIQINVTNMDSYFAAMRFIPQYEGKVWGSMVITSLETGETLAEIKIDEAEDGADSVKKECYGETFGKMAKRTAKLK